MQRFSEILARVPVPADLDPALAWALAWTLAAGPALAPRARCESLCDGVLRLRALDAGVRGQVQSVAAELRRSLNRCLGANQVQRIEILDFPSTPPESGLSS